MRKTVQRPGQQQQSPAPLGRTTERPACAVGSTLGWGGTQLFLTAGAPFVERFFCFVHLYHACHRKQRWQCHKKNLRPRCVNFPPVFASPTNWVCLMEGKLTVLILSTKRWATKLVQKRCSLRLNALVPPGVLDIDCRIIWVWYRWWCPVYYIHCQISLCWCWIAGQDAYLHFLAWSCSTGISG
jgi:hypothetical protein